MHTTPSRPLQFAINAFSVALPEQVKSLCGMRTNTSSNWLSDTDYLDPTQTTPNISQAVGTSSFDTHFNGQAGVSACVRVREWAVQSSSLIMGL